MQLLMDSSSLLFCDILSPYEIDCKHSYKWPIFNDEYAVLIMQWFILFDIGKVYVFYWNKLPALI